MYIDFKETMRVRMLTYTEAINLGCEYNRGGTCPNWLYANIETYTGAYWISAADSSNEGRGFGIVRDGYLSASWVDHIGNRFRPRALAR